MVLVQERLQRATDRWIGSWCLGVVAVLIAFGGCIPSSAKYPYQAPDTGNDTAADACDSPTEEELCDKRSLECGAATVTDRCGESRTVNCGDCADGATCTKDNTCCQPENDTQLCESYKAECGTLKATDQCGELREVAMCGSGCADGVDCNGTTCGTCDRPSDDDFCARYGRECGALSDVDSCGDTRTVDECGPCINGSECENGDCVCPFGERTEVTCNDGEDNDCDGAEDCEDEDCENERCGDGLDSLKTCSDGECTLTQ